jgi:hypothetical protein
MRDTHNATHRQRSKALPRACAMISRSLARREAFLFLFREAGRSKPMMAADRSTRSIHALLFLIFSFGLPNLAAAATLEDSAKEFAQRIAAALPGRENVTCEIRNQSSLRTDETARVEQTLKAELADRGVRLTSSGAAISVVVTLSENFKDYVWTGEIRQGETSRVVLITAKRSQENRILPSSMPVAIRSEKFWEGPERILDAGEVSDGVGKSWVVLLLTHGVRILDRQTGFANTIEITPNQSASRDPEGFLKVSRSGATVGFFFLTRVCSASLETLDLIGCSPTQGSNGGVIVGMIPILGDAAPPGPPQPGKGTEVIMTSVCNGSRQFLATGAGDYSRTDSLQVFQMESDRAVAISAELNFPGPITALHAGITVQDAPSAVVRNLTTGNYEAYRLSISCGQ